MSIGLLWSDKTENEDFSFFNNYRSAFKNYFKTPINEVDSVDKISQFNNLIIVDEHYGAHNKLICDPRFIESINRHNINVVIFNTEKIFNSYWIHNLETQKNIEKLNNCLQILSDVNDIKRIGTPFKNKQYLSKEVNFKKEKIKKNNKILFFGQLDGSAYKNRRKIIDKVSKSIDISLDVFKSTRSMSYEDYMQLLSEYRFVLNPLGAGEFINIRYYETLKVGAIPVQQMTPRMSRYYNFEIGENISINFHRPNMLKSINFKNFEFKPLNFYLEDYFYQSNLISYFKD